MSNCQFILSIKEINPLRKIKVPITNFLFQIKTEFTEGEIKLSEKDNSNFIFNVSNLKDNLRISIRLFDVIDNRLSLIGLSEFIIPILKIKEYKPEESFLFNKTISLSMIDSTKRFLFESLLKSYDIIVKIEVMVKILPNIKGKINGIKDKKLSKENSLRTKKSSSPYKHKITLSPKLEKTKKNNLKMELYGLSTPPLAKNKTERNEKNVNYTEGNFLKNTNTASEAEYIRKHIQKSAKSLKHKSYKSGSLNTLGSAHSKNSLSTITTYSYKNPNRSMKDLHNNRKINKFSNKKGFEPRNFLIKRQKVNGCLSARNKMDLLSKSKNNDDVLTVRTDFSSKAQVSTVSEKNKLEREIENLHNAALNPNEKEENLKEKLKAQYKNIISFEKVNQKKITDLLNENQKLNKELLENNELYRTELKKKGKIKVNKKEFEVKRYKSTKVDKNKNNEEFFNKMKEIKKSELKIFQKLFNKYYYDFDVANYDSILALDNISNKEKYELLLNYVKNIVSLNGSICRFIPYLDDLEFNNIKTRLSLLGIKESNPAAFYMHQEPQCKITEEDEDKEDDGTA